MGKYPKARVVPFSSVVGSSVTLHDPETERVIGQLAILNTGGDTPEDRKQRQILVAEDTAKRINCHDRLAAALQTIADIAEGSTTANSLPHIAKLARAALVECAKPMSERAGT